MIGFLLASTLVAGLPQGQVETLCNIVAVREARDERGVWKKAWIFLSFGGADMRPEDKAEIINFCRTRPWVREPLYTKEQGQ